MPGASERGYRSFVLEVKNTGDRPIHALSLVRELTEVRMSAGNYGATFRYGRGEFITVPGERPKPDDVPIQPMRLMFSSFQTCVLEVGRHARDNQLSPPKSVMVWLNFVCFGDGTCLEGFEGKSLNRKKS